MCICCVRNLGAEVEAWRPCVLQVLAVLVWVRKRQLQICWLHPPPTVTLQVSCCVEAGGQLMLG